MSCGDDEATIREQMSSKDLLHNDRASVNR